MTVPQQEPKKDTAPEDPEDRKLWNSYVYRAWKAAKEVGPSTHSEQEIDASHPAARVCRTQDDAISLIVSSAFLLECRLRYVYDLANLHKESSLERLLLCLWQGLQRRCQTCERHADWPEDALKELAKLRDKAAHGNLRELRQLLNKDQEPANIRACRLYNAVIDAVAILNVVRKVGPLDYRQQDCQKLKVALPS